MIRYKSILFVIVCILALMVNAQEAPADNLRVTGRVLDASTLAPLPGMRLSVPGVSAAMTGNEGQFSLRVPPQRCRDHSNRPGLSTETGCRKRT
ncbi:MAG: carboxypeptidase-like regulatory domain-containing protein [Bacteroides sp.]|nr:carboxypeptidase-like regulatory domain-containing protein [Bacteroides sp.]